MSVEMMMKELQAIAYSPNAQLAKFKAEGKSGATVEGAEIVGKLVGKRALDKGIETVVFDRGGHLYHGRVAALADGAREAGLKF